MNATLQSITTARTIHGNFNQQDICDEDLETILSAALRAANASNRQSYSIVVLDDREVMRSLCGYAGSRALLFCVDYTRLIALAEHLGHEFSPDGVVSFVTGSVDTVLAAQNAVLAARSLGIDSLLTNGIHRKDLRSLYAKLGLPEQFCFPLIMLVLGYPTVEPQYLKGRVAGPGVVHYGAYHRQTPEELDAMVQTYDDPARHIWLSDAWGKDGCAHYLDWFFTNWTGPRNPEKEEEVRQVLTRAGFWQE
jgi:nitroreductase